MLQDQLQLLEKKELNLLEYCNDPMTSVTTAKVQDKLIVVKDDFENLNELLKEIDQSSQDIKSKLIVLDTERRNICKLQELITSLTQFKVAILQGTELLKENKYVEILGLFSIHLEVPDFKRLQVIPPTTNEPIQLLFERLQNQLSLYLATQTPTTIPGMIGLLKSYFLIYKNDQGITIFIKSIKSMFDEQLAQIQEKPIESIVVLIKCMDGLQYLSVKLHEGLKESIGDQACILFFEKFYKYTDDLVCQLYKKWLSSRTFNRVVAELKTLDLKKREDGILYIDTIMDLKDLSKYCNEHSSVLDRYFRMLNYSELNKLFDFKKSSLFAMVTETWQQYKIIEVVYLQSCLSRFFLNFNLHADNVEFTLIEESVHLLKSCYTRAISLGNIVYIDDMLYCLNTIATRLLIENLVQLFSYALTFEGTEEDPYTVPIVLLKEIDGFNDKLDGIHNHTIQQITKLTQKINSSHSESVEKLFLKRFDWNFKPNQIDDLIRKFYNAQLKRSLLANCRKLFRDVLKIANTSKYVIPIDISNTMLESKLLGNNPTIDIILNQNFGEFSMFKNDVFVRLLMESVDVIVDRYLESLFDSCMNLRGAVFYEKDVRSLQKVLDDYFHKNCLSDVYFKNHQLLRNKFSKLTEIAIIVNCDDLKEAEEMIHDPSYQWSLSAQEIRKSLLLRNDFKLEEVAKMKI